MPTMKAYTDLEQSKKLAIFLPPDSADMEYLTIKKTGSLVGTVPFVKDDSEVENSAYSHTYNRIACWSLAALLELIPPYLGEFKDGIDFGFSKAMNSKWYSAHYIKFNDSGLASFNKTVTGDTAIDAAFEMVCWLKENNKI